MSNNTTGTNTISLNLTFSTNAPTISQAANGSLILSGTVANGGNLADRPRRGQRHHQRRHQRRRRPDHERHRRHAGLGVANNYGGNTTVSGGTLQELINGAASTGTITENNTGTLILTGNHTYTNAITLNNGATLLGTGGTSAAAHHSERK